MFLDELLQDVRYGIRKLRKSPGFTTAAVLTLALGIGSTTAIYAVADALLFRPLPYRDPDALVGLSYRGDRGVRRMPARWVEAWREQVTLFVEVEAYQPASNLVIDTDREGEVIRGDGAHVTAGLFPLLGVQPRLGRLFSADEAGDALLLIGHATWTRRFGARADVLGRTMRIDGEPHVIVGVMPPRFNFPTTSTELWMPTALRSAEDERFYIVGRLRDGLRLEAAERVVASLASRVANDDGTFELRSFHRLAGQPRRIVWILLAAVTCLLLIACTNTANLVLSHTLARQREFAVRAALGAGRLRLARQILSEVLVLGTLGGLGGLVLAYASVRGLARWLPPELVGYGPFTSLDADVGMTILQPDTRLLTATVAITTTAALLAGLIPALRGSRRTASHALRGATSAGTREMRVRGTLIVVETALAVLLVVSAGLLVTSFARLVSIDPGYHPDQVVALRPEFRGGRYETSEQRFAFFSELMRRADAQPALTSMALADGVPLHTHGVRGLSVDPVEQAPSEPIVVQTWRVSGDYFDTLGITRVAGRTFNVRDSLPAADSVIIGDQLARRLWPSTRAVGRQLRMDDQSLTVVGVVGSVTLVGFDVSFDATHADVYLPLSPTDTSQYGYLFARAPRPDALVEQLKQLVWSVDPNLAVHVFRLDDDLWTTAANPRFTAALVAAFAVLAVLLAAVGVAGLVAFEVAQRTQEIGIRTALGANRAQVIRLVMKRGTALVVAGVAIGVAASLGLSRYLESLLFEVSPTEPSAFAGTIVVLVLAALLASYLPARRAARADPMEALRAE